jgi:molybdenum cofactor synthesis domain-containing protein
MREAKVNAVCIAPRKGERKRPVEAARFVAGLGIEGDAHAGSSHRQISLLAEADVYALRREGLADVGPGDFGENVVTAGLDTAALGLGSRLRLGPDAAVVVTQIGKKCHDPCRIYRLTGTCVMPRAGLFARVEAGGEVRPGDAVEVLEAVSRDLLQAVVLTISDRCSRGEAEDTAGPAVRKIVEESLGARTYATEVLPDEEAVIAERLRHYCDGPAVILLLTVGGTGFAPRDVTPEATRVVVDRPTPGLDEAMRAASLAKTPYAILSRGSSGIRGTTLIINLPGSERAAVENLEAIVETLPHAVGKLRGDDADCSRPSAPEAPRAR